MPPKRFVAPPPAEAAVDVSDFDATDAPSSSCERRRVMKAQSKKRQRTLSEDIVGTCKCCAQPLVKQWVAGDGMPAICYSKQDPVSFDFGKHKGKPFESVHKNTILMYLTDTKFSAPLFTRNRSQYCGLHRFLLHKWPTAKIHTHCDCYTSSC